MAGAKNLKRARRDEAEDDSADEAVAKQSTKNSKKAKTATATSGKDNDGNPFWALSATRRIGISDFKGKVFVNIREYWTDQSGDLKPGKKGISLPLEQYAALVKSIPSVNAALAEQGHDVPDVSGGGAPATKISAGSDDEGEEAPPAEKKKAPKKPKKSNIEATSDEEEEEEAD